MAQQAEEAVLADANNDPNPNPNLVEKAEKLDYAQLHRVEKALLKTRRRERKKTRKKNRQIREKREKAAREKKRNDRKVVAVKSAE